MPFLWYNQMLFGRGDSLEERTMGQRGVTVFSLVLWLVASGRAMAATPPAKVVQQFIEAHLQGQFAAARGLTLEQVQLNGSLFSNWLFGAGATGGGDAATADVFLSRKFAQAFRYNILDTTPNGDNQVVVTVVRSSPNLAHLYTWALAPQRGAPPYTLVDAIDTYMTKVNFPVEESRMEFTLIAEAGEWYISAIRDEKFLQLQTYWLSQPPPSAAAPPPGAPTASGAGPTPVEPPVATTTTDNPGRQLADAQFNATLQGFNRPTPPPAATTPPPAKKAEEKPPLLERIFGAGKSESTTSANLSGMEIQRTVRTIREALQRYAVGHNGSVPGPTDIYDWSSLRQIVKRYSKTPIPTTEEAAGLSFVRYRVDPSRDDYTLLLELHEPQDGLKRIELTALSVDRGQ
jgi:hypothetical protein